MSLVDPPAPPEGSDIARYVAPGMIAVLQIENIDDAAPLATALRKGGIRTVELALRTPAGIDALRVMLQTEPELMIGAGTVLSASQADAAKAAGAAFAVAPGFDPATVDRCRTIGLPFAPGVATPSEVQAALAMGCFTLKFFPAESFGGIGGLRALNAPFAHLAPRFIPLGGIDLQKARVYLAEPSVAAVGGSWIAPTDLIRRKDWARIEQNAAEASHLAACRLAPSPK